MTALKDRLLSKVEAQSDGCWAFTGALVSGYGQLRINGQQIYAHRLSWIEHNGPIPKGLYVLHKCDNRWCINPDHLFLGTYKDNSDDMIKKGRAKHDGYLVQGERNGHSILKEKDIIEIKRLLDAGFTHSSIGEFFGVTRECITRINRGINWRHV